ncbi:FAD-binding oxidoreductase [Devosia sp. XJ19-1]|uniref:FAD-binding oxidoreductase n=1 Tax=Devosia ureilytica TaxID=2952754 RepID=A0A9Q4AM75_9HYPH|nr:FAD-binding oxidoreductase [Devosia ureilytica]MCP8881941.1 FAD-binding oxidoreductase [Devosia ureilytica]MCP8886173.1 FAD-binding oxidoreductase [Devosia ureilytica]
MNLHAPNAFQPYDPQYDPLVDRGRVGENRDYAPTYWIGTAGPTPEDDGPVTGDMDVDVAIIGSGYTGLSTAIHLAKEHGIKATVLEANRVAWGCSTRNGGQAQLSAGRLKRSEWIQRWGMDTAKAMHAEVLEGFELFNDLIKDIDCDAQPGGHLFISHKAEYMAGIEKQSELNNSTFGYKSRVLSRAEVHDQFVGDQEAKGALYEPYGTGIHAAKLAFGYLRLARSLGAKVHTSSPVSGWTTRNGIHYLQTPNGVVRARRVAVATAAYTPSGLNRALSHRLMPILSNSVVTRVLTAAEIAAAKFQTRIPLTDSRILRHYYRLLPDNRLQIGSRSSITGADATNSVHEEGLRAGMARKFPHLADVRFDYSWWGWVDMSHDMMPRITKPDPSEAIYYAMGYGGNGVMYSAQAGRRMAAMIAGKTDPSGLPIFSSPLPHYGPLITPFRRLGQRMLFVWYHLKDEGRLF